jgi:tripartite-type tricarboxylate transporter receptor subunit TctC
MSPILKTVALLAAAALTATAGAQSYPARPIRVLIGFPAGSTVDILARPVAARISELLGQQVVVDNRAGATGIIANELVVKAPADGYTLLATPGSSLTTSPHMHARLNFDVLRDLVPVALLGEFAYVLFAHPAVPVTNVKEIISLARAKPGVLTFGSAGVGSGLHLAVELFKTMAQIDIVHVPYKGGPPAVTDMLGGRIDMMFYTLAVVQQHIKSGRLRAIAMTGMTRDPLMPQLPTVNEAGLPGFETSGWHGFLAPSLTPKPVIAKLNATVVSVLDTPAIRDFWASQGMGIPRENTPEQCSARFRTDYEKYGRLVKSAGIKPE